MILFAYKYYSNNFAGRLGIEPRLEASKASVLPLDDLPINKDNITYFLI